MLFPDFRGVSQVQAERLRGHRQGSLAVAVIA
jgi:hypothetical protein